MSKVLARWNSLPVEDAAKEILPCCGSKALGCTGWQRKDHFSDVTTLLAASDETWSNLTAADWMEAFRSHPRIGESLPAQSAPALSGSSLSKTWSAQEQRNVAAAGEDLKNRDGKSESGIRATIWTHLYRVCDGKVGAGNSGYSATSTCSNDEAHRTSRSGRAATADYAYPVEKMALDMNRISTHVLDTSLGKPATGIPVRLERRENHPATGQLLGTTRTDRMDAAVNCLPDDRISHRRSIVWCLIPALISQPQRVTSLYPVVEVTFEVRDGESHFHIPLLLSPNGYTTYRGT